MTAASITSECTYCSLPTRVLAGSEQADERIYCCYGCRIADGVAHAGKTDDGVSWMLVRLGSAVFLSMNVMIFSLFLYSGDLYGNEASTETSETLRALFRYGSLLFATPVVALLGIGILENALAEFSQKRISSDLLFAAGVAAAMAYSVINTVKGSGHVYYETVCMILVVVTLGKWLEAKGKLSAARAVEDLRGRLPDTVEIRRGREVVQIPSAELRNGDEICVKAGQAVPVDGTVIEGGGQLDESMITGEALPTDRTVGQAVQSGTLLRDGFMVVRANAVGEDSTLARLVAMVREARTYKSRIERLTERLAGLFVPVVFLFALGAGTLSFARAGFEEGLMTLLAVALISCPCALGIATPMALWTAMGLAARRGVLFRNTEAMERLVGIKTVLFDKTGTLTAGRSRVSEFETTEVNGCSRNDLLSMAAGLSEKSAHHAADAITRFTGSMNMASRDVTSVKSFSGSGVSGIVEESGERVQLGNERMMRDYGVAVGEDAHQAIAAAGEAGLGTALLSVGSEVRGVFTLADEPRPETTSVVRQMIDRGMHVAILTGDRAERAAALGRKLGIPVESGMRPEDKLEFVRAASAQGTTAMVGDGINDAPALAAADVGIALGCGADVARESADVCLVGNNLELLPWTFDLAAASVRTVKQNLAWAVGYNIVGIGLAAAGLLHPIFASLAMIASSLFVVANSHRIEARIA